MPAALFSGYLLGLSLITAIGAQNAFVLRQGLRREHVLAVVLICAVSDAALIVLGVAGFGHLAAALPGLETGLRLGGAAFLTLYALRSFRAAWRGGMALHAADTPPAPLARIVATCLAFTWLNPHVWLDTVVLIGAISTRYAGQKHAFALGAMAASFSFFFALGYGARLLRPVFAAPRAWQILEAGIGVLMLSIAAGLLWPR